MPDAVAPTVDQITKIAIERFEAAVAAGAPQIYFNSFVNMLGTGDVVLVLERNGRPSAIVNMSYTVTKTLAVALGQIIAQLEEKTGRDMLTIQEVAAKTSAPDQEEKK